MPSFRGMGGGLAALVGLLLAGAAQGATTLEQDAVFNLPTGVTPISREIYGLHMYGLWVVTIIGVLVFGVMGYSLWAHSRKRHPVPAKFHENTTVEVIWTLVPFLILVSMALPAAATLVRAYNTSNPYMTVKVTGSQWRWVYEYPDFGVGFVSSLDARSNQASMLGSGIDPATVPHYLRAVDHPMVVPEGKKVRLLITSADVDHAWSVMDLGIKKNAYPGFINEVWFNADRIGTYTGQCTVLCGRGHSYMPTAVKVVSLEDFNAWVKGELAAKHTLHLSEGCDAEAAAGDAVGKTFPVSQVCGSGAKARWQGSGVPRHGTRDEDAAAARS